MRSLLVSALCLVLTAAVPAAAQPADGAIRNFIADHPGDVALSIVSVGTDGAKSPLFGWNESQPMPLASSMKIVLLAAYAQAVAAGALDPDQPVTLKAWEAYYQPGTDGGAHGQALQALGLAATEEGRAVDAAATVPLDQLAGAMIAVSDNTAADYLMMRLGQDAIRQTIATLGLGGQTMPMPVSGLYAAWMTEGEAFLALDPKARIAHAWDLAAAVPERQDLQMLLDRPATALTGPDLAAALVNRTPPMGTSSDYAMLMARVLADGGLPPAEAEIMRRHLGWAMDGLPAEDRAMFRSLYTKGGSFSEGVLTANLAFDLVEGPRLSASLFLRNIPPADLPAIEAEADLFLFSAATDEAARQDLSDLLQP